VTLAVTDRPLVVGTRALVAAAAPAAIGLAVGALALIAFGDNPLDVYRLMFVEAFGGEKRIAATLSETTPLIFTGLATSIAFRAGVFNVGGEGSLYLGGIAAAYLGYAAPFLPGIVLIPSALALAALAGAFCALPPALMRARLDVDEVVTTLMFNFIVISFTSWLVNGPLLAPGSANSATPLVVDAARLPRLLPPSTLNIGLLIALALLALYGIWARYTAIGFETRLLGLNARFSRAAGLDAPALIVKTMLLSGAIGGLAGGVHALGVVHRFVAGFSPGYGFTGIAVALLGRNSVFGMLIAALVFGALATSSTTIQLFSDIPLEITGVIQGAVMIFAVAKFGRRPGGPR
jgi:general nucleoside transport system permease protein